MRAVGVKGRLGRTGRALARLLAAGLLAGMAAGCSSIADGFPRADGQRIAERILTPAEQAAQVKALQETQNTHTTDAQKTIEAKR